MTRIAILDLYEGQPNQGMRCIRQIIDEWSTNYNIPVEVTEFDVRLKEEVPDMTYDIFISSGGPGSPLDSEGSAWETAYFSWLEAAENWNANGMNESKKHVFFICHSFQLVCRHYGIGDVSKRLKTSFGVYPVHVTMPSQLDPVFRNLPDPFYVVDSRDYQVTLPNYDRLNMYGGKILCIEKFRPHVPLDQAIMGVRFNDYMVGTQFHPEADAMGMSMYLQREDKKQTVIENHGEEKWRSMITHLNDPDKIMYTYAHLLPNFLTEAKRQLKDELVMA